MGIGGVNCCGGEYENACEVRYCGCSVGGGGELGAVLGSVNCGGVFGAVLGAVLGVMNCVDCCWIGGLWTGVVALLGLAPYCLGSRVG